MFWNRKKAKGVSISLTPGATSVNESLISYDVGVSVRKTENGKQFDDEIVAIVVDEQRMAVEVRYHSGSKVVYKGYRFVYVL